MADGKPWIAHVLSLTAGLRRKHGDTDGSAAAVFVREASLDLPLPIETVSKVFQLTPGESRILAATLQLGGGGEVAMTLGIAEAAVKSHLQHIFAKTGASRQSDLVARIGCVRDQLAQEDILI
jgi:DNA-binding CsgD family transcriptional regulator